MAEDLNADHSRALRIDAASREIERYMARQRKAYEDSVKCDPVLVMPNLKIFKPAAKPHADGHLFAGCRAWDELACFLAAVAQMDEVAAVAPQFRDHLEAAVECLEPFMRVAREREEGGPEDEEEEEETPPPGPSEQTLREYHDAANHVLAHNPLAQALGIEQVGVNLAQAQRWKR
jgi:hypothetical protein